MNVATYKLYMEIQQAYLPLPIPNLRGNYPISCSGKPNPRKRQSHLHVALRTSIIILYVCIRVSWTYHNSIGVVNDDKENVLDEEGETEKKSYHTDSNSETTRIGATIKTA